MAAETLIFWIGTAGFGLATLYFALLSRQDTSSSHAFNTELFVSFITTISYALMATGLFMGTAPNNQPIYWTRWLFYIGSCSLLTTDIAQIGKKSRTKLLEIALYTGLVMLAGFLASYIITTEKWWFFGLSSIAYLALLYELSQKTTDQHPMMPKILRFVYITWSLFPVVWILAPTGFGVITTLIETILYGLLDLVTKILFGLYLIREVKGSK